MAYWCGFNVGVLVCCFGCPIGSGFRLFGVGQLLFDHFFLEVAASGFVFLGGGCSWGFYCHG